MPTVTIFPEFQVAIPRAMIDALALKPSQKLQLVQFKNRIELTPIETMQETQSFVN
ncbi:MAG: AbrB family transcriptional regulator [Candidatus Parabeggiatoa sp. nov. 1]|nr:MAG: AbrB family transcriptional regulator [Gammaproteobacteria bacterium]